MTLKTQETNAAATSGRPRPMNIVVIGHVDHGKSTVIGRLLADTNSLPTGKLEEVRRRCDRNARPFEYAFLLDALKDEQAQGITIDSARCFFRSSKREYIIIDAPGHVEFLKNMVSGAARAEAALLVIDAKEGIRENSRRHGYLLSMLGIRQVAVLVNKMDLVDHSQAAFEGIRREYTQFLANIGVEPQGFVPVSAINGDNIAARSQQIDWYDGPTALETVDGFENTPPLHARPLRFPVQDVYKFTEDGDDRRIVAGRIETGSVSVDDEIVFYPSGSRTRIAGIEAFNSPRRTNVSAGESVGFTLREQIYVQPGELMCRAGEQPPAVTSQFRANIFWMGRAPMVKDKRYKIKLAGARVPAWLKEVHAVMDASDLTADDTRRQVEWHDVARCTLETLKPVGLDLAAGIAQTGRFVIIDNYEIAGGGIVLDTSVESVSRIEEHVRLREKNWDRSAITPGMRAGRYKQRAALVLITGPLASDKVRLAKAFEEELFNSGRMVYYLGLSNSLMGLGSDVQDSGQRDEYLRRLGETAHLFTDAGVILITTASDLDDYELEMIKSLNRPGECIVVSAGGGLLSADKVDLVVNPDDGDPAAAIATIKKLLRERDYLVEYYV